MPKGSEGAAPGEVSGSLPKPTALPAPTWALRSLPGPPPGCPGARKSPCQPLRAAQVPQALGSAQHTGDPEPDACRLGAPGRAPLPPGPPAAAWPCGKSRAASPVRSVLSPVGCPWARPGRGRARPPEPTASTPSRAAWPRSATLPNTEDVAVISLRRHLRGCQLCPYFCPGTPDSKAATRRGRWPSPPRVVEGGPCRPRPPWRGQQSLGERVAWGLPAPPAPLRAALSLPRSVPLLALLWASGCPWLSSVNPQGGGVGAECPAHCVAHACCRQRLHPGE